MNDLKKKAGLIIEIVMYAIMLFQMLYVFMGNTLHEIMGIILFACMVLHIFFKRKRIKAIFSGSRKRKPSVLFSEIIIILLFVCMIIMAVSSMGVSRTVFPWFHFAGDSGFHRIMATVLLTLSVIHGGMHVFIRSRKKKTVAAGIAAGAMLSLVLGLWAVPYMNRHFRHVETDYEAAVSGEKVSWNGEKPLVVYFTRVGNTDFDEDVEAVSGASLMLASGKLTGNTQLLSAMICDAVGCDSEAITLSGEKYPSSYDDTISVAGKELKENARPKINPIDISAYDSIILVYPIWWGTVPMPVASFLTENDFTGKNIYLVATQGSSGFAKSTEDIQEMASGASVTEGISVYCDDIPDARGQIVQWLKSI